MSEIAAVAFRPELVRETLDSSRAGQIEKPLSTWERLYNIPALRKALIIAALLVAWQLASLKVNNPLMFPTFTSTVKAFWDVLLTGELLIKSWYSVRVLLTGYALAIVVAVLLTIIAVSSRIGNDFLETLTAMFNPLPAVAVLPLALLWFGLGNTSLTFVLVNAVLWPMSLNIHSGFKSVSNTLRMVGHNYGLGGFGYVAKILIPAALPSILTGLKIGWAFAWRTLIAAELVFGVSSGSGGLGWFIYENKNQLEIPLVFAGLFTVILIGLAVEGFIFRNVEARTIRKWGMQQ